jgi:guanylate kinase
MPIVFSGPSGAGKSTLIQRLRNHYPNTFGFSISHTTRQPRPGEITGEHYHFVSHKDMQHLIESGAFLETMEYAGNLYGTTFQTVETVLASGKICILDLNIDGMSLISFMISKRCLYHDCFQY